MAERYHGFDALRATALLLGVVLHAISAYFPRGRWAVTDASTSVYAALIIYVIHLFRIPVFFLMAGFFGRMLAERGEGAFVKDRLRRILLPLLAGWMLLYPVLWRLWSNGAGTKGFDLFHLWFLYYLLLLYAAALMFRRWPAKGLDRMFRALAGNISGTLVLAIPYAAALLFWRGWIGFHSPTKSLMPDLRAMAGFGSFFLMGWLLHRQPNLLEVLAGGWIRRLALAAVITLPMCWWVMNTYLDGSFVAIPMEMMCVLNALAAWFWTLGLAGAFHALLKKENAAWRYLADASYWVYLAHLPLVAYLQIWLAKHNWGWSLKSAVILAITLLVMLVSYQFFVRPTLIGALLNGRRRP